MQIRQIGLPMWREDFSISMLRPDRFFGLAAFPSHTPTMKATN